MKLRIRSSRVLLLRAGGVSLACMMVAVPVRAAVDPGGEVAPRWPDPAACEPWPDLEASAGMEPPFGGSGGTEGSRGAALLDRLTDPNLRATVDFVSRNIRGGGVVLADGEPIDVDVPDLVIDVRG